MEVFKGLCFVGVRVCIYETVPVGIRGVRFLRGLADSKTRFDWKRFGRIQKQ